MARIAKPQIGGVDTSIISLKVTLRGVKPPIWRRLLMPGLMTLGDLHFAIQATMGWQNCHLHAFDIDGRQYGERDTDNDVADEDRLILMSLVKSGISRFSYRYDFGDNWEHAVIIEKIQPAIEGKSYPACVGGKRNCPPEDCGGIWGYENLLKIIADPTHREHAEQIEWLGEEFDPEEFSAEFANTMLATQFTRN